jgi:hypothetical protein
VLVTSVPYTVTHGAPELIFAAGAGGVGANTGAVDWYIYGSKRGNEEVPLIFEDFVHVNRFE